MLRLRGNGVGPNGRRLGYEPPRPTRHRRLLFRRLRPDRPRGTACRVAGVVPMIAYLALGVALTYSAFSAGAMAGLWLWSVTP